MGLKVLRTIWKPEIKRIFETLNTFLNKITQPLIPIIPKMEIVPFDPDEFNWHSVNV